MRAFVTGAGGFVGHHLVAHLLDCGDTVIASTAKGERLRHHVETIELDITNYHLCVDSIAKYSPDVVYHLAGMAFVPQAEDNFSAALNVNVAGTSNMARAAHLCGNKPKFLLASSAEVYGKLSVEQVPVKETTEIRPANNYSLTKAMAEMVVTRYADTGSIVPLIMRPFNHIGAGQNTQFVASSFAWQLSQIKKGKVEPVIRVGNLTPQRDFSDVRDIVKAYRLAAIKGDGIYNLGAGKAVSIQYILDTLIEISGLEVKIEQDSARMRPSEVPVLYGDISKASSELGWHPSINLRDTLSMVYESALSLP